MKRCPTCGNTYTNDGLVFCLEDGARLTSLSNPQSSFDPEATLHLPAEENALPPTEAARPQGAQTFRQASPPLTAPPRVPHSTRDDQAPPPVAAPAPATRSTSAVVVAGITAIVVLLLVIAGIGIALLMRNSSQGTGVAPPVENNNRAANRETNRNSSNAANDGGTYNSANGASSNGTNRNGSTTATDPVGRAEGKVVRGASLYESDLTGLSREELRRLRNAVYARHGRTFDSADLQRYFETRPWYRPRSDYNEAALTATDLANIKLIQTVENGL